MSGYIHVLKDLLTDPRFRRSAKTVLQARPIFESLALAETVTLGCLVKLWLTADSHISDADTLDFGPDEVDEFLGIAGIPQLLGSNWLEVLDANQVRLPNYLAHNGIEARRAAQAAARQAKHRAKGSNGQALHDVTHPVTHERDTQSRETVKGSVTSHPLPSLSSSHPLPSPASRERRAARARTRQVPADFEVTQAMREWAARETPESDVDRETALFRDHEFKDPHSNWLACWRKWMRRAPEFQGRGSSSSVEPKLTWRPPAEDPEYGAPDVPD